MKCAPYLCHLCRCVLWLSPLTVHLNSAEPATWYGRVCQTPSWLRRYILIISREGEWERGVGDVAGDVSMCAINHWHSSTPEQLVHSEVTYNIMDSLRHPLSLFFLSLLDEKSPSVKKHLVSCISLAHMRHAAFCVREEKIYIYCSRAPVCSSEILTCSCFPSLKSWGSNNTRRALFIQNLIHL